METKIIAIANQKGGVGKTATTLNLGLALTEKGYNVLLVDVDHQSNLSSCLGFEPDGYPTIDTFIIQRAQMQPLSETDKAIRRSKLGIDYIPCSLALSRAEGDLWHSFSRERVLSSVLEDIVPKDRYHFVLIDNHSSLGIILNNVMIASDYVLIPVQTKAFSKDAVVDMLNLIKMLQHHSLNPKLKVLGLLPSMTSDDATHRSNIALLHETWPELVLPHSIQNNAHINSCLNLGKSLTKYKKVFPMYSDVAADILNRLEV